MAKALLAETFRVSAPGAPATHYEIKRVAADPRLAPGLAAPLGTIVEYVTALGSVYLQKYTTWDRGWRLPGGGPVYPRTADEFLGATKITPGALYLYEAFSSTVFDASGGANDLPAVSTPSFQNTQEGKVGVWYDSVLDAHAGAVNDPAATSFAWGCVAALISDPSGGAQQGFSGRNEAATGVGYMLYFVGAPTRPAIFIRDAAAVTVTGTFASDAMFTTPRRPFLLAGQVDRVTGRIRGRMCRDGVALATLDVALGAVGTLTAAAQVFGSGNIGIFQAGGYVNYNFYATGAQIEGANVLRDLAVGLGWEV